MGDVKPTLIYHGGVYVKPTLMYHGGVYVKPALMYHGGVYVKPTWGSKPTNVPWGSLC